MQGYLAGASASVQAPSAGRGWECVRGLWPPEGTLMYQHTRCGTVRECALLRHQREDERRDWGGTVRGSTNAHMEEQSPFENLHAESAITTVVRCYFLGSL
jgi:hypothetical protein